MREADKQEDILGSFMNFFARHRRLWLFLGITTASTVAVGVFLAHGPDFTVEWNRDIPSRLSLEELAPAFRDIRNWPVYFHALKTATIEGSDSKKPIFEISSPGTEVRFEIEPRGKEWKRYTIRARVLVVEPGKRIRFLLLEESTGKTTKLLDGIEWETSVRPADEHWKEKGYLSVVHGEVRGTTRTGRARFLGRLAERSLLNQIYLVDLLRLANFVENQASWAGNLAPVYR